MKISRRLSVGLGARDSPVRLSGHAKIAPDTPYSINSKAIAADAGKRALADFVLPR
jgi:hypothetical protein